MSRFNPPPEPQAPAPERPDDINNPAHYKTHDGRDFCLDVLPLLLTPEEYRGFLKGAAYKYQFRYARKQGVKDLQKAEWFLNRLRELYLKELVEIEKGGD